MRSMELEDEEKLDFLAPLPMDKPDFPYHLRFALTESEFKKLDIDPSEAKSGESCTGRFHARITSVHSEDGKTRVEFQIEDLELDCDDEE